MNALQSALHHNQHQTASLQAQAIICELETCVLRKQSLGRKMMTDKFPEFYKPSSKRTE